MKAPISRNHHHKILHSNKPISHGFSLPRRYRLIDPIFHIMIIMISIDNFVQYFAVYNLFEIITNNKHYFPCHALNLFYTLLQTLLLHYPSCLINNSIYVFDVVVHDIEILPYINRKNVRGYWVILGIFFGGGFGEYFWKSYTVYIL